MYKVATPSMDDHQFEEEEEEENESVGDLSTVCSHVVLKCLYLARIGRPDILWSVNKLARAVTKWTKYCDKRLAHLISYIHHTNEYRQYCYVGNTAQQCRLGLFQDSDFAGDLEDSKSTSGGVLCFFRKSHVCANKLDVQETDFSFTQFYRSWNHFSPRKFTHGRHSRPHSLWFCLLNPCNVLAQLVTSQLVTIDLTLTCFLYTDVLGPSRISWKQHISSTVQSAHLHVLRGFPLLQIWWLKHFIPYRTEQTDPRESHAETSRRLWRQTCIIPSQSSTTTSFQQTLITFHQIQRIRVPVLCCVSLRTMKQ